MKQPVRAPRIADAGSMNGPMKDIDDFSRQMRYN